MAYKRQIAYFDLMEDGLKKGNAGFCKREYRGGNQILSVSVSGLSGNISEKTVVYIGTGKSLGDLELRNGRAQAAYRLEDRSADRNREFDRVRIPLSQGRELSAEFQAEEVVAKPVSDASEMGAKLQMPVEVAVSETGSASDGIYEKSEEYTYVEPQKEETVEEDILLGPNMPFEEAAVEEPALEKEEPAKSQTLWEILSDTCEKMHPFGTEAEYYRIALEDIYRLKEECHMLRNNPFLLHGYYNYRYLILGKKESNGNEFWLGVPGIYHEREKMAARMYGFEKFEGTKPDYRVGDLGYYLITAM